jgi:hypothetical protein
MDGDLYDNQRELVRGSFAARNSVLQGRGVWALDTNGGVMATYRLKRPFGSKWPRNSKGHFLPHVGFPEGLRAWMEHNEQRHVDRL